MERAIGILGGTFDPLHNGHVYMAQKAIEAFDLEKVILLPSGKPPHKRNEAILENASRLQMAQLIAEQYGYELSDYEINKESTSYTVETIEYFKGLYPDARLMFIIGGDSLTSIHKWFDYKRLLGLCELIVIPRRGDGYSISSMVARKLNNSLDAKIHVLDISMLDISSTRIRSMIKNDRDVVSYVPKVVYDYILDNKLYR